PDVTSVDDVAKFLGVDIAQVVKTLVYRVGGGPDDGNLVGACIRGDDQLQETKLVRALLADNIEMASDDDIKSTGSIPGFVGPGKAAIKFLFDDTLKDAVGLITGANEIDRHAIGFSLSQNWPNAEFTDLRQTRTGDGCPKCDSAIELSRGIEVGHVFALGTCYSEPMEVQFQNREGKRTTATMGCYGIGVSRLMAAVVEQCNDENGIAWPLNLAPFQVAIITMGKSDSCLEASEKIYRELLDAGIEVLWDDRKERPGVKFKDAELMGLPVHLVVGDRGLENGVVEIRRRNEDKEEVQLDQILPALQGLLGGSRA
ncbi:MAG: proline--tRNA ligase, partial [Mariprofundaceae bacterium]|nr:proline--tRNA ligase [Mariprofundaceae bacterium]